jgi:hypothetical protein
MGKNVLRDKSYAFFILFPNSVWEHTCFYLVPKLRLGTHLFAKLCFA